MEGRPIELASLRGVRKQYGKVVALDGVDLAIAPGQVLALLGANGAGKSTAIALLLGLVRPDAGQALLSGQSPQQLAARRNIGVMLQSAGIADNSKVRERSEEHTSELQSLMRISYAVFCLKKKNDIDTN